MTSSPGRQSCTGGGAAGGASSPSNRALKNPRLAARMKRRDLKAVAKRIGVEARRAELHSLRRARATRLLKKRAAAARGHGAGRMERLGERAKVHGTDEPRAKAGGRHGGLGLIVHNFVFVVNNFGFGVRTDKFVHDGPDFGGRGSRVVQDGMGGTH